MTTNIEQDRIEFEAWHKIEYPFSDCEKLNNGNYKEQSVFERFIGWQAALKLQREHQASEAVAWGYAEKSGITAFRADVINNWSSENKKRMSESLFAAPQQSNIPDGWISINDKLPDDGIYCIVATIKDGEVWNWDKARYSSSANRWMRGNDYLKDFTHWKHLLKESTPPIESDNKVLEAIAYIKKPESALKVCERMAENNNDGISSDSVTCALASRPASLEQLLGG